MIARRSIDPISTEHIYCRIKVLPCQMSLHTTCCTYVHDTATTCCFNICTHVQHSIHSNSCRSFNHCTHVQRMRLPTQPLMQSSTSMQTMRVYPHIPPS